ncbi:MAG: tetratricopeptide repeat protein [Chloroflexi bacterium]|nr:tetratricopeptide repeat protein [Chloroflexota bacterium]
MVDNRFQQALDQYLSLKGQLAIGRISHEQFDAALKQLMIQDAQGRYWMIGPETGQWYVLDGQAWVEAQPGESITPLFAPFYPPVASRQAPSAPVLVAVVGIILGLILVGILSAVLLTSNASPLQLGQRVPTQEPIVALALATKVMVPPTPIVIVVTTTPVPTVVPPSPTALAPTATPIPTIAASPTANSANLVAQADQLMLQSKFDDAAALYQRATNLDRQNAIAYAHWARLLDNQCYLEMREDLCYQAVNKAEIASQLAPNDPKVLTWMARAYDWSAIYDKALTSAQKAVQFAPNWADAFAVLAEAELDNGKLDDAERDATKALQLDAMSAEAHRILGYILSEKKQNQSAVAEFDKAAQVEPTLAVRQWELGVRQGSAGNSAQAMAAYQRAIALYPRSARAYQSLGIVYRDQKLYDKSIEALNTAIQINSQSADLYAEVGQSYLAAGQLSAAINAAQKGATIDPSNQKIKTLQTALSRAQGIAAPTTAAAATSAPAVPPGVYVTNMRTDPPELKHGQMPTFQVTFLNTLGISADYIWYVKLYEPDKKYSFGETAKSSGSIPAGSNTFSTFSNWVAPGASPCRPFIARVFYIASDNQVVEFPKPGGESFWYYFSVCK